MTLKKFFFILRLLRLAGKYFTTMKGRAEQYDQIWRNFAPWSKLENTLAIMKVYFVLGKILYLLWQIFMLLGKF